MLRSGLELFIPLEGVIDLDRERARLREEVARADSILAGARGRLANEKFTSRAPADVVQKEREKVASLEEQRDKLTRTLRALEGGE